MAHEEMKLDIKEIKLDVKEILNNYNSFVNVQFTSFKGNIVLNKIKKTIKKFLPFVAQRLNDHYITYLKLNIHVFCRKSVIRQKHKRVVCLIKPMLLCYVFSIYTK